MEPYCIFQPGNAQDVSSALTILRDTQTRFAVRGNGYMPVPGAADVSDSVPITLTRMRKISISNDRSVATIGRGLTWGGVYDGPFNTIPLSVEVDMPL